jgi:hypothetical protein
MPIIERSEPVKITSGLISVSSNIVIKIHQKVSNVSSSMIANATIFVLK